MDDRVEVCLVGGDLQMIKVRRKKHHWMIRGVVEQQVGTWRQQWWSQNLGFLRFWGGWRKGVEVWSISRVVLVSASTKTFGPRFINQGQGRGE